MKRFLLAANNKAIRFYMIIAFILLWQFAPDLGLTNPTFVPPFTQVLADGAELGLTKILVHICISMKRVIIGFAVSAVIALPLGFILNGGLPKVSAFLRPLFAFLQQIPPYILYPVFLLVFGPGENGIYLVIFWSVFFPILFTTQQGVSEIDAKLIRASKAMNCNGARIFLKVVLPATFPSLMRGIRSGLSMAFLMLIGAESMGADSGIGWMINNAQKLGWITRIYLGALIVCVIGFALNYGLGVIEKVFVDWKPVAELET
ncbi:MAG: ABC transporter permease [Oscillospiraceae bacterium]|jgi:NitT/TauT family transport system permease protein|nr:ABC transporter permease [Oscillospiraceae bacterium]